MMFLVEKLYFWLPKPHTRVWKNNKFEQEMQPTQRWQRVRLPSVVLCVATTWFVLAKTKPNACATTCKGRVLGCLQSQVNAKLCDGKTACKFWIIATMQKSQLTMAIFVCLLTCTTNLWYNILLRRKSLQNTKRRKCTCNKRYEKLKVLTQ